MSVCLLFYKNERVNTNEDCDNSHNIKKISSSEYNTEVSNLLGNDLVLQGVHAKQTALLYVVETFGTLMHCLLCQTN